IDNIRKLGLRYSTEEPVLSSISVLNSAEFGRIISAMNAIKDIIIKNDAGKINIHLNTFDRANPSITIEIGNDADIVYPSKINRKDIKEIKNIVEDYYAEGNIRGYKEINAMLEKLIINILKNPLDPQFDKIYKKKTVEKINRFIEDYLAERKEEVIIRTLSLIRKYNSDNSNPIDYNTDNIERSFALIGDMLNDFKKQINKKYDSIWLIRKGGNAKKVNNKKEIRKNEAHIKEINHKRMINEEYVDDKKVVYEAFKKLGTILFVMYVVLNKDY
ncbi:MAG: hypothetical protein ACP5LH_03195, partial [Candidatus Micrarchaeia archaeon]